MTEALIEGRRMYLFTRPDGTYFVSKPKCCRRIFPETEQINRGSRSFSKSKTADANLMAWNKVFSAKKDTTKYSSAILDEDFLDETQGAIQEVEELLKDKIPEPEHRNLDIE